MRGRNLLPLGPSVLVAATLFGSCLPPAVVQAAPSSAAIAWGSNAFSELGDGTTRDRFTPVSVRGTASLTAIAAGWAFSLALRSDGTVVAWGYNGVGQLGDGTRTNRNTPVSVTGLSGATAIVAGFAHSLALERDGSVVGWGGNFDGELGDGTTTPRLTPVPVRGLTDVAAIAAGDSHSLALKTDGTVLAWGSNFFGQLGDGTSTDRLTPVPVLDLDRRVLTGVTAIAAGGSFSLALKNDGTLVAWGSNVLGQLGDGTNTNRLLPVPVGSLNDVTAIAAGSAHGLALRRDSSVVAWGYNGQGELGDGTTSSRFRPVPVSGLTNASAIAAAGAYSLALKRDGSAVAWGSNRFGQLGDCTTNNRLVPVPIGGLSGSTAIAAGPIHSLALGAVNSSFRCPLFNVALNGSSAYLEVDHAPDLNIIGDWTVEMWFKDENPSGFDHNWQYLINKGDRDVDPELPYFAAISFRNLVAGNSPTSGDQRVYHDLVWNGVDLTAWHHMAASFSAPNRQLILYLDGTRVSSDRMNPVTSGNRAPLNIGRNGAVSGKYFRGKLGDVRLWNVARSSNDIAANYADILGGGEPGLVANWRFDEGNGATAQDSVGDHTATLNGGARFGSDVHP